MIEALARGAETVPATGRRASAELAAIFKVLSDPTRLAILALLMQGVQCNCEIGDRLDLPMNLISHHLKALRKVGLVNTERDPSDGRWIYYSIDVDVLARLRDRLCAFLDPERVQARQPSCGPRIGCER